MFGVKLGANFELMIKYYIKLTLNKVVKLGHERKFYFCSLAVLSILASAKFALLKLAPQVRSARYTSKVGCTAIKIAPKIFFDKNTYI